MPSWERDHAFPCLQRSQRIRQGVSLTSLSFIQCKDYLGFKLSHFFKCISVWYPTFNRTVITFYPSLSVDMPLKAHPAWVLGLMSVTGHLLLLAPGEDVFWMFASMMDVHLPVCTFNQHHSD